MKAEMKKKKKPDRLHDEDEVKRESTAEVDCEGELEATPSDLEP